MVAILNPSRPLVSRLAIAIPLLLLLLAVVMLGALTVGAQSISLKEILSDPTAHTLFFRLRLPRVLMGALIGASLALVGAALQALFRNPLADPFILGVSGGGAVGASLAIAFGIGAVVVGIPFIFIAAFVGAACSVFLVYGVAKTGRTLLPGALLLSGVAVNLIAAAGVLIIQFFVDPSRAHQILRWTTGSLDVVGFTTIMQMSCILIPSWIALLAMSHQLHLLAIDKETATTLGVDVRRSEILIHLLCSLMIGVTVAVGGAVGFVGLIVPHGIRMLFGEDLRIVLPGSLLLGAAFLVGADTVARTALSSTELPVGAITALLGGPAFLWLLRRRQRYSAL
jgi:iron complex transport system permease protein